MDEIEKIKQLAIRFRRAVESLPTADRMISMKEFPRGSCGDASLLFGTLLADLGFVDFKYICGERGTHQNGDWTSHAWLQRGDLIVDLTADQFEDAPRAVIVEVRSLWHDCFEHDEPTSSDFRDWSGPGTYELPLAYSRIRRAMDSDGN